MKKIIYYVEDLKGKIANAGFKSASEFAKKIKMQRETVSRWCSLTLSMSTVSQVKVIKELGLKITDIKSKFVNIKKKK